MDNLEKVNMKQEILLWDINLFSYRQKKKNITISELCDSLGITRTHPYFLKVFSLLVKEGILDVHYSEHGLKLFNIRRFRLRKLVDSLPLKRKSYLLDSYNHNVTW